MRNWSSKATFIHWINRKQCNMFCWSMFTRQAKVDQTCNTHPIFSFFLQSSVNSTYHIWSNLSFKTRLGPLLCVVVDLDTRVNAIWTIGIRNKLCKSESYKRPNSVCITSQLINLSNRASHVNIVGYLHKYSCFQHGLVPRRCVGKTFGVQQLLSTQCRSCGAGSSYIWLLGLCWRPCWLPRSNNGTQHKSIWIPSMSIGFNTPSYVSYLVRIVFWPFMYLRLIVLELFKIWPHLGQNKV